MPSKPAASAALAKRAMAVPLTRSSSYVPPAIGYVYPPPYYYYYGPPVYFGARWGWGWRRWR